MNFRKNNGYVGVDASMAVLILLILIPTITGIIFNINSSKNATTRKTEATSIAANTIEAIKGIGIDEINSSTDEELYEKIKTELDNIYTGATRDGNTITLTKEENTYQIIIENIEDFADTDEGNAIDADEGIVKKVTVIVNYKSGNKPQSVEISTAIS